MSRPWERFSFEADTSCIARMICFVLEMLRNLERICRIDAMCGL
jgi:hypothetical protein